MEQNRPIKELLQIMLDNEKHFELGLCLWSLNLCYSNIITHSELRDLRMYINGNKPWWARVFS
jgi:hypothetical protein